VSLCGPAKVLLQKIGRADNRVVEGAWRCPFLDRQPALNQAQIATQAGPATVKQKQKL